MIAVTPFQLDELGDSLGIGVDSHGKSDREADFSRSETTHLLRIADVLDQAPRPFGDRDGGLQWIDSERKTQRERAWR
jgi:hypothetical protein